MKQCQPPKADTRAPKLRCPPGSTDCHVHVYGPDARYPVSPDRFYDAPQALPQKLRSMLEAIGIERAVLVQPSGYGMDNRRQLDAAVELGLPARVVASAQAGVSDRSLQEMHEKGVRALRYTVGHPASAPLAQMPEMSRRIAKFGWHIELHMFRNGWAELQELVPQLATDIVIEHGGSIEPGAASFHRDLETLLRLLGSGKVWVKLSAAYRFSRHPYPFQDMDVLVQALAGERIDRLVWASDWPHVSFEGTMPEMADLLDALERWIPDEGDREKVLVANPDALYFF